MRPPFLHLLLLYDTIATSSVEITLFCIKQGNYMKMPILTFRDYCVICGKGPQMGLNRPHSLKKTKKVIRPNLGVWNNLNICASCRKSLSKPEHIKKVQVKEPTAN